MFKSIKDLWPKADGASKGACDTAQDSVCKARGVSESVYVCVLLYSAEETKKILEVWIWAPRQVMILTVSPALSPAFTLTESYK